MNAPTLMNMALASVAVMRAALLASASLVSTPSYADVVNPKSGSNSQALPADGVSADGVSTDYADAGSRLKNPLSDRDREQLHLLDRLRSAGLISEALYTRRQQAIVRFSSSGSATPGNTKPGSTAPSLRTRTADVNESVARGRHVALVIGSNDYQHVEPLETAINDARAIGHVLRNRFGFDVEVLENPSRLELFGALAGLQQSLAEADSLLLYYAGHGILDNLTGRGYWLPTDAEPRNPANWVSNTEISDALLRLPVRNALIIADSCFAGSLAGDDTTGRPVLAAAQAPDSKASDARIADITETSTPQASRRSRMVMTSGGLEPVLDSIDGEHSVFTRVLLDQLADLRDTDVSGLFEQVAHQVQQLADQTPTYISLHGAGHQGGDYHLPTPR